MPGLDAAAWCRAWIHHTGHEKDINKQPIPNGRVRTALHCIIAKVH
jgi:hypothetical protein